ncbi:MAG: hypothetical protein R6U96_18650 [Promethearchaeia archaeon]
MIYEKGKLFLKKRDNPLDFCLLVIALCAIDFALLTLYHLGISHPVISLSRSKLASFRGYRQICLSNQKYYQKLKK